MVKLFVARTEMEERLAVAPNDRRIGAVGECHLPGIVFSKTFARLARPPLQFGTLRRVLKTDVLWNEATDKFHAFTGIFTSLEKLGRRNAADKQRPLRQGAILPQPRQRRPRDSCRKLAFERDQE